MYFNVYTELVYRQFSVQQWLMCVNCLTFTVVVFFKKEAHETNESDVSLRIEVAAQGDVSSPFIISLAVTGGTAISKSSVLVCSLLYNHALSTARANIVAASLQVCCVEACALIICML